ncbi:MAG: hypothetical protein IJ397_09020 [Lachnospiraceae bacterium]|nr:hypothetical protein [Lachnospiraceae bacterium]
MKKYIILLSVCILIFVGLFAVTKVLDERAGVGSNTSAIAAGTSGDSTGNDQSLLNSMQGQGNSLEVSDEGTFIDNPEGTLVNQTADTVSAKLTAEDWQARQSAGVTNSQIALTMQKCSGMYAYDNLPAEQKQLYAEILLIYQTLSKDVPLCSNEVAAVEKVSSCVLLDHPEIFYSDGYSYNQYMFVGTVQKITYSPNYTLTREQIEERKAMVEQYATEFLKELPATATDYDKVKYVYEMVILNTEYNLEAPDNQNICSVFLGRESVCLGYAKAVQYLLRQVGVESVVVTGSVITGEAHAWNLVKVNGQYYYVDATWGDASYMMDSGAGDALATINYDYLNITTQDISHTHIIDNPISVPNCMSQIDNYYVKEGLYLNSLDAQRMEEIFKTAYSTGQDCVSIRCSSPLVYGNFQKDMLDNQQIFNYLGSGTTTLAYTSNDKLYTYTFML